MRPYENKIKSGLFSIILNLVLKVSQAKCNIQCWKIWYRNGKISISKPREGYRLASPEQTLLGFSKWGGQLWCEWPDIALPFALPVAWSYLRRWYIVVQLTWISLTVLSQDFLACGIALACCMCVNLDVPVSDFTRLNMPFCLWGIKYD